MTDRTPTCCELACYEDPGCTCDGCAPDPAPPTLPMSEDIRAGAALASALMAANYGGDSGEDVDRLVVELLARGYRLARLLPPPDPAPLDVERLARALRGRDFQEAWHFDGAEKAAAVIAREYAKEPQP